MSTTSPPGVSSVPNDTTTTTAAAATTTTTTTTTANKRDPGAILASTQQARTLTVSDQHANLLLTLQSGENALLKLTLVPFHKDPLARLIGNSSNGGTAAAAAAAVITAAETEHSNRILQFLSDFQWRMTSESGAEYSFHEATPITITSAIDGTGTSTGISTSTSTSLPITDRDHQVPKKRKLLESDKCFQPAAAAAAGAFKAELIYPASGRQVARAMPSPGLSMITETAALYQAVTKPFIDGVVASGSLSWLQNIVQVKKEKERLLLNADGWILNIDTKWRSHPDALTVPRSEWYQHESVVDLYCLGILKEDGVSTARDLDGRTHLPMLREMLQQGPETIERIYGVPNDQLRIFVHYQPQFYHFHVHFTRLENDTGAQVEKAHLLVDLIQDLEQDPDRMKKKTFVYKLSLKDRLYKLWKAHEQEATDNEGGK